MKKTLGFIGFGKMSNAICKGIIQSGFMPASSIFAYDINQEMLAENAGRIGINALKSINELAGAASNILIGTKPFTADDVLENLKDFAVGKLIISILAGITIERYENALKGARIVRVMPNAPAMVNAGMSVVCGGKNASDEDVNFAYKMFSKLGEVIILDETKINVVTAVSGSGPAFYYYIIDKIACAGAKIGLDYNTALKLSAQTALGAAKMILQTALTLDQLITAVTTPGGTTAEGNKVLQESDIEAVLFETVNKTCKKAIEIGAKKAKLP